MLHSNMYVSYNMQYVKIALCMVYIYNSQEFQAVLHRVSFTGRRFTGFPS